MRGMLILLIFLSLSGCNSTAGADLGLSILGIAYDALPGPKSGPAYRESDIPDFSDKRVCQLAAAISDEEWSQAEERQAAVAEAKARGITPATCRRFVAKGHSNRYLCSFALQEKDWTQQPQHQHYVRELQGRGMEPGDCEEG